MRAKRWGRILTVISSGVIQPIPILGISNTLRGLAGRLVENAVLEVAADGITANILVPGRIDTERVRMTDEAVAAKQGLSVDEVQKRSFATIPLGPLRQHRRVWCALAAFRRERQGQLHDRRDDPRRRRYRAVVVGYHEETSMSLTRPSLRLTYEGAQTLLAAAVAYARRWAFRNVSRCVDDGCNLLAFARMDGARVLSIASAQRKAMTAASTGKPTGNFPADIEIKLAIATDGEMVNLLGGLPVIVDGHIVGGIGVGSGTGEQDREVANVALRALSGAQTFSFSG